MSDMFTCILAIDSNDVLAYTTLSCTFQKKGMIKEAEEAGAKGRVLGWKQQLEQQKKPG